MSLFNKTFALVPESASTAAALRELASRQSGLFSTVLDRICAGMTPADIAQLARAEAARRRLRLSFKDVLGFPEDISVSTGAVVINGIPGTTPIKDGEIVRLALGTHDERKAFSVQNWSVCVGEGRPEASTLLSAVRTVLEESIQRCQAGARFSELSRALEESGERAGLYVSAQYRGSQIGSQPIIGPPISTPRGIVKRDAQLVPGVFLSFFVLGHSTRPELSANDQWSVRDRSRALAASFSHIVEVTEAGPRTISSSYPLSLNT